MILGSIKGTMVHAAGTFLLKELALESPKIYMELIVFGKCFVTAIIIHIIY